MLGRFTSPDSIIPDSGSVIGYNRFAYVNNNPLIARDPSGHVTCNVVSNNYQGDCLTDINALLVILDEQGGDVGKELVLDYYDKAGIDDRSIDALTVQIVDKTKNGAMMDYNALTNTFRVTVGAIESAKNNEFGTQLIAGAFAHEIVHMNQGFFGQPSLRAETEAYHTQLEIYENMGIADDPWEQDENGKIKNPIIATASWIGSYYNQSDYEIITSPWANTAYNDYPLERLFGLVGYDLYVRNYIVSTHVTKIHGSARSSFDKVK